MNNNLERLIRQKIPFKSPVAKVEVGFMYLCYILNNESNLFFKKYDITSQQYNVLRILRGQYPNPANINLIKERMLDKMSDASRIVDRLKKNDLVTKHPNDLDKRNTDVVISEKALILLKTIDEDMNNTESLFNVLEINEINMLNELIDKILGKI